MIPRKLGKHAPRHDPRTLLFERYIDFGKLPKPPDELDLLQGRTGPWPMHANDDIGDCTIAALANQIETWTADIGHPVTIPDTDVLAAYSAVSGYIPGKEETDQGASMLDVLGYWRRTGLSGHTLEGYASIRLGDPRLQRTAAWLFSGLQIGINLPLSAKDQIDAGEPWTFTSKRGRGKPGSWGGHAVYLCGYDAKGVILRTWDEVQRADWRWMKEYCDEIYACLDEQDAFIEENGTSISGFDVQTMRADLRRIGK